MSREREGPIARQIPEAARRALRVVGGNVDALCEAATLAFADDMPVACRRDCTACCRLVVTCSMAEAMAIHVALDEAGRAEWFQRSGQHLCRAQVEAMGQPGTTTLTWQRRSISCVLLTTDGDCSVYEDRPRTCRMYLALGDTAPAACSVPGADVASPDFRVQNKGVVAACADISDELGLPQFMLPLPLALLWAHEFRTRGPAAWRRTAEAEFGTSDPLQLTMHWAGLETGGIRTTTACSASGARGR
jgi:Fe-S-cluster containining protein